MHIQLTSFLNKNEVLSSFQLGFPNKHCTNYALISLANDHFACGVFINLHKAFDTVDHKILLSKMNPME